MDLQNSFYDEDLYERCEDLSDLNKSLLDKELYEHCEEIEMLHQTSNGYSPASQAQYFTFSGINPLLIEWEDEEDTEMYNTEAASISDDAYEPLLLHELCFSPVSQNEWIMEWQE